MKLAVVITLSVIVVGAIVYGIYLTINTPWDDWDKDDND